VQKVQNKPEFQHYFVMRSLYHTVYNIKLKIAALIKYKPNIHVHVCSKTTIFQLLSLQLRTTSTEEIHVHVCTWHNYRSTIYGCTMYSAQANCKTLNVYITAVTCNLYVYVCTVAGCMRKFLLSKRITYLLIKNPDVDAVTVTWSSSSVVMSIYIRSPIIVNKTCTRCK
jgi:hypothetical protein